MRKPSTTSLFSSAAGLIGLVLTVYAGMTGLAPSALAQCTHVGQPVGCPSGVQNGGTSISFLSNPPRILWPNGIITNGNQWNVPVHNASTGQGLYDLNNGYGSGSGWLSQYFNQDGDPNSIDNRYYDNNQTRSSGGGGGQGGFYNGYYDCGGGDSCYQYAANTCTGNQCEEQGSPPTDNRYYQYNTDYENYYKTPDNLADSAPLHPNQSRRSGGSGGYTQYYDYYRQYNQDYYGSAASENNSDCAVSGSCGTYAYDLSQYTCDAGGGACPSSNDEFIPVYTDVGSCSGQSTCGPTPTQTVVASYVVALSTYLTAQGFVPPLVDARSGVRSNFTTGRSGSTITFGITPSTGATGGHTDSVKFGHIKGADWNEVNESMAAFKNKIAAEAAARKAAAGTATTTGSGGTTTVQPPAVSSTGTTTTVITAPTQPPITGPSLGFLENPLLRGTPGLGNIDRIEIINGPDGKPHGVGTGNYAGWDFGEAKEGSFGWRPEGGPWTPPPEGWQPQPTSTGVAANDQQTVPNSAVNSPVTPR